MKHKKLIFVRHGKDDERYRGGWSNFGLTAEGIEQSKKLAKYLKENNSFYEIDRIISSDLPRVTETADYLAKELGLPVEKEESLREINNGDLSGMLNEEALAKYPGLFFRTLQMDEPYPNGESPNDYYVRVKKWFDCFVKRCQESNENILIVTHGGVVNIIYHIVKKLEWNNKNKAFKVTNGSIHILNLDTMEFSEGRGFENASGF